MPKTENVPTQPPLETDIDTSPNNRGVFRLAAWFAILVITLLAFFMRVYQLNDIPPGFHYDEAAHAIDALDIIKGNYILFSTKVGGVMVFFMYLIAGFFQVLGPKIFSQRLLVAFIGTATLPATFLLARTMFRQLGESKSQVIGILAASGLATSFWHLAHSRFGLEYMISVLLEILCFCFLWQGFGARRWWYFLISGAWLGLALQCHPLTRFIPVLLLLFFLYLWFFGEHRRAKIPLVQRLRRVFLPLVLVGISALVVFSPVAVHFILHPADFFSRASDTWFMNPNISEGRPWTRLMNSIIENAGAFGFTSDGSYLSNLPGRSILDPIMAVLFGAGLLLSSWQFRKSPYFFCVLWWGVLLLPAILTPDRTPHFGRLLGVAPVVYIMIALSVTQAWSGISKILSSSPRLKQHALIAVGSGTVILYVATAVSAYNDYFFRWAVDKNLNLTFDVPAVELAQVMNADKSSNVVFVLPCSILSVDCDYYPIDFSLHEGTPYHTIQMDESEAPEELTQIVFGKNLVKVIELKTGKWKFRLEEADPKRILAFLLERSGQVQEVESFPAYDIVHYRLHSSETDFTQMRNFETWHVGLGGELVLHNSAWGDASGPTESESHAIPTGGVVWALLHWGATSDVSKNYKASLQLIDGDGHLITQVDHFLQDNWQNRTTRWRPEDEVVSDYYILSIPHTTPPGEYSLEVVVYSPETMSSLVVDDGSGSHSFSLGLVRVVSPETTSDSVAVAMAHETNEAFSPEISLAGYDWDLTRPYLPGEEGSCAVYWLVKRDIAQNLQWQLEIKGATQSWFLIEPAAPLGPDFPTSKWAAGQLWRGVYDFRIPAEAPGGEYQIVASLTGESGQTYGTPIILGILKIEGRVRNFDIPPIEHIIEARFEDKIRLLGYDLEDESVAQGGTLRASLYWQALSPMDISYTLFIHVLDRNGQLRAQRDAIPGEGTLPTTGWLPGEVISERLALSLDDSLPTGSYTLVVGAYDASTGQRLALYDDDHRMVGDSLPFATVEIQ